MKIFKQKNQRIVRVLIKSSGVTLPSIAFVETNIDECMDSIFSNFSNFSNPTKTPKCTIEFRDMIGAKTLKYKSFKIFGITPEDAMSIISEEYGE